MCPTRIESPRSASVTPPKGAAGAVNLATAAESAAKGQAFKVDADTAKKLVSLFSRELGVHRTAEVEWSERHGFWKAKADDAFRPTAWVEVDFAAPVKHPDGPFHKAFIDPKEGLVWFVDEERAEELELRTKVYRDPRDLMGKPPPPQVTANGGAALARLDGMLSLTPRSELTAAPKPAAPARRPSRSDEFDVSGDARPKTLSASAVAKAAREYILEHIGESARAVFPPIDSGNNGIAAFVLTDKMGGHLIAQLKESVGVDAVERFTFDPKAHAVFAVTDTEDEPGLHVGVVDRRSGKVTYLSDVLVQDLPSNHIPDTVDAVIVHLDELSKGAKWLSLGRDSAPNRWWE